MALCTAAMSHHEYKGLLLMAYGRRCSTTEVGVGRLVGHLPSHVIQAKRGFLPKHMVQAVWSTDCAFFTLLKTGKMEAWGHADSGGHLDLRVWAQLGAGGQARRERPSCPGSLGLPSPGPSAGLAPGSEQKSYEICRSPTNSYEFL